MRSVYRCEAECLLDDLFRFSAGVGIGSLFLDLLPGQEWTGRLYPQSSKHSISSVEVVIQRMVEEPNHIWLYTLEHPRIDKQLRFSSRSELKMLQVLLDNTLEYIFFRDIEGNFILTNETFREAASFDGKMPDVDRKIEDFVVEKSAAWVQQLDDKLNRFGSPIVNESSIFTFKNGMRFWLQMTTVPVRNSQGKMIGSLSVARDISDLKRTEADLRSAIAEAHAASRAKGEFLAAMSHEIRTPINGIVGASELCQETPLDIEQRGYLDTVIQCGSTLLGLVNDVLDFSKIEAGQLNLESLNFSPRNLIESLAEEFAQSVRAKKLELIVGYDDNMPEFVMGDPVRVKQVLYNLIGNAIKFTEAGEIMVRAHVVELNESEARIAFSVTDTGIGISDTRQKAIFDSFTQEDMSTTRKFGGSGLGLAISRELVRLMGGTISVKSEQGKGSEFFFTANFALTDHYGANSVPFNSELAGLRVLIVDDNETNCDLYSQMCSGWGYRSSSVGDGIGALAEMEQANREGAPYGLILLDQQMPGLTGLDFASLVKSRPDLRDAHILLLSSSLNRTESERASEIGIDRALSKPVRRATLQEVILETFGVGKERKDLVSLKFDPDGTDLQKSLQILLVEDNPVNQDLALRRLKKSGHQVALAENGAEAVELVRGNRFDCILMDIQMPVMDGHQATIAIRELEASLGRTNVHIVAMTAHAMKGDRERCLESGMNDYISKPFRAEILNQALSVAAGKSMSQREREKEAESTFASRLGAMEEEDREDVLAAAPLFLKSFPKDVLSLQNACADQDYKKCYFLAHTLKGVAGIFGSEECMELAKELEEIANTEDLKALKPQADRLLDAMSQLVEEIESAMK